MKLIIKIDGGSRGNPGPASAAVVIHSEKPHEVHHEAAYFLGRTTNNVAEYSALIRAVELAVPLRPVQVDIYSDSELLVRQITGQYRVKSPELQPLFEKAQSLLLKLDNWQIKHVYRESNRRADELANIAIDHRKDHVAISTLEAAQAKPAASAGPASSAPTAAASPTAAPAAPTVRPAPVASAVPAAPSPCPRFVASFVAASPAPPCPAPGTKGQSFTLGPATPAGLCIHAAQAVLEAIDLADDAAEQPRRVTCRRCRAALTIEEKA